MYYIVNGMGKKFKPLAIFFAFSGILVALLGIGTFTQVNAISSSIQRTLNVPAKITGLLLAVLVGIITFGGITAISKVAEKVVPVMAGAYIIICLIILIVNYLG